MSRIRIAVVSVVVLLVSMMSAYAVPVPIDGQVVAVQKNATTILYPAYTKDAAYTSTVVRYGGPYHGTMYVTNGTGFVYTPSSNYVGPDPFQWQIAYSNATTPRTLSAVVDCDLNVIESVNTNADWTQWRHDEYRSAQTSMILSNTLYLQWRRDIQVVTNQYLTYPEAEYCRPVQLGKSLFVGMVANDSVSSYDTDTGALNWRFYTEGALRRPPVALRLGSGQATNDVVVFGCDDGYVYCLNAANGTNLWKFRAAPNAKKAMGFGRLGSLWPIWASPVAYDPSAGSGQGAKVYVVAGLFPSWGLHGYCLDAATGAVIWRNDGRMYGGGRNRPSNNSAVGPLTFSYDHGKLFGASAVNDPWALDAVTGEMITNSVRLTETAGLGAGTGGGDDDPESGCAQPLSARVCPDGFPTHHQ